jgi:hypothetical protein
MTGDNAKIYKWALLGALIALVACIGVMAAVPPVSRDALTHHLAVPKIWIGDGIFKELPSIPFSYYPMNLDLLYMLPLLWGNDIVPKYIHFSFALLTAGLIHFHLRQRLRPVYGLLGALFFLSIPVIVKLSITVYVDLGLIFFTTAALFALIHWVDNHYRCGFLLLSAVSCGLAMGTKYNGLIVFFLLSCLVPLVYSRGNVGNGLGSRSRTQLKALGFGVLFIAVSLLVFSPWMIKNLRMTGNPIYPLYNNLFVGNADDNAVDVKKPGNAIENHQTEQARTQWSNFAVRKVVYGESLLEIAMIPVRVFFEGVDDNPKHFDGRLNPFLLILPLILIPIAKRSHSGRRAEYWILSSFVVTYLLFVFVKQDMRIRWISPIIPPLVVLSMYSLAGMKQLGAAISGHRLSTVFKGVMLLSLCIMFAWNAVYIQALFRKVDPIPYISGRVDRDTYITRFRPEYALIRHINRRLPDDALILCLFIGDRIYYFDREVTLDKQLLVNALIHADSAGEIGQRLNLLGITHLLIRFDLTQSWMSRAFNGPEQTRLKTYLRKHATPIAQHGGYGLFELHGIN